VPIHAYDSGHLRKPVRTLVAIEAMSGCRMAYENPRKMQLTDPIASPQPHGVWFFGDKASQDRALEFLAPQLPYSDAARGREDGPTTFSSFDPEMLGESLELTTANAAVRRCFPSSGRERAPLRGLVVAGKGPLLNQASGGFFALKVLRMDPGRKTCHGTTRGGTRIGISTAQPKPPVPVTLLSEPKHGWVLGRGFVRGPDGRTAACEAANIDAALSEGDELGVLVAREGGTIALFRRADRLSEWTCFVHLDAKIAQTMQCFAFLELSGAILEVELLQGRQAPLLIDREAVSPVPPKKAWP